MGLDPVVSNWKLPILATGMLSACHYVARQTWWEGCVVVGGFGRPLWTWSVAGRRSRADRLRALLQARSSLTRRWSSWWPVTRTPRATSTTRSLSTRCWAARAPAYRTAAAARRPTGAAPCPQPFPTHLHSFEPCAPCNLGNIFVNWECDSDRYQLDYL